ncbi:high-affinity nitrate transporter 3.1-like [Cynara cardunculus var. scolymus]|uniref:high-affinity nitrate transporter 3.1-like n=1 Tax=Cynara cardunculus var. scolymus TaxID=59895 RepID=UPI000D62BEC1|nr:high-affinity nitrate transporter 3.1-like [Cynara cardunculus var. scolymus]XP_024976901.1 high-affinity nitrate transporter 3.1-like [Cynara cardunculus var. scolymus]
MEFCGGFVVGYLLFSCFAAACYGVTFSSLQKTLIVTASSPKGHVLKAGEDQLTVKWAFDQTFPAGTDSTYKTIRVKLCYAPLSQVDKPWRKSVDDLNKDKTCQHKIVAKPYTPSNNSFTWTIETDVPKATYFVRAYALDERQVQVGYGQNTDASKVTDLFDIRAISGRHVSLDIASVCFSVFSVVSLAVFFYMEKRKGNVTQKK